MVDENSNALVLLHCSCGREFHREQKILTFHDTYKTQFPHSAKFFKRKIDFCDFCFDAKVKSAFNSLPRVIESLESGLSE